ncbi:MAG TPA: NFACT family protein [Nitrososphaerales archaeon]|nr:NFACT family protein [Nitrososphaerales archaeon]
MAELSGLEVFALTKEIESGLSGTYVKNVYSLGDSQVLRFGRPGGEDVCIVASPRHGVWVSRKVAERAETTGFTTRLRQELVRERFATARQLNRDRIFDLTFGDGEGAKHLIIEAMSPGNIIVTDSRSRILAAQSEVRAPGRRLVRGGAYSAPAQRRKSPAAATAGDVSDAVGREKTAGGAVGRGFSLPKKYVAEVLSRLRVEESSSSSVLRGREDEVASTLRSLVREAEGSAHPCVCETPGGEDIFVVIPHSFNVRRRSESVSELCDEFLLEVATSEVRTTETQEDTRARQLEATVSKLRAQHEGLVAEAAKLRGLAARARGVPTVSEARAYMDLAGLKGGREVASQESAASAIYDRAKDLESKADDAEKTADALSKKTAGGRRPKSKATKELRRTKQEWYEKFRWFTTSSGKLAVGGRDAESNSVLVKRHLEGEDTVYHADLFGSPFFVLKGGRAQTDEECAEVAQATVAFSSAWKTGLGAADAYWVSPDQVSTSAPSGEFLARGSFVIRGRKNFIPHNLVEVAVGVGPDGKVLSGPESAIRRMAAAYVVMRPQKEKSSETAKRVKKDLESLAGGDEGAHLSLDEVLRMLPSGGGKVLRKYTASASPTTSRNA